MISIEDKIEARLKNILRIAGDIICLFNKSGVITHVNPHFTELENVRAADYIGKKIATFISEDSKEDFNDKFKKIYSEDYSSYTINIEFIKGFSVTCSLYVEVLYDEIGKPIGIFGVARDVRKREEVIAALEESKKRYRLLEEHITDILWTSDLSLSITYISSSIYNVLGYTVEEFFAMPREKTFPPDSIEKFITAYNKMLEEERGGNADLHRIKKIELQEICKDGTVIDVEMSIRFLRDEKNTAIGVLGVSSNITDRKKSELELKRSEAKYKHILENMHDAYYEVDINGTYTYVNNAACKIFGYEQSEIIGMNYKGQYKEEYSKRVYEIFTKLYKTEEPVELMSWNLIRKDGQVKTVEASVNLLYDSAGNKTGFCGVLRDMTERIRMTEALRESEQELRKRNEEVEKDLQTAQFIIKSIFTEDIPEYGNLKIDYRYYPLEAMGGDYFSLKELDEGGLSIFLADVASHGVSAALFLSLIKATTDRVYRDNALVPKKFIEELNRELLGNMPLSFLTAIYGLFLESEDGQSCVFSFTASGHPYPVLFRGDDHTVDYLECRGPIIGKLSDIKVEQKTITLNRGDRLFLYTDGLPETMNSNGDILGYEEMLEVFKVSMKDELAESLDEIIHQVSLYRGDIPFDDDIILLGFEI